MITCYSGENFRLLVQSTVNNNNNNNNNDDDDDDDDLLQSIQQSEALHLQYLHYKSTLKKEIYNNI